MTKTTDALSERDDIKQFSYQTWEDGSVLIELWVDIDGMESVYNELIGSEHITPTGFREKLKENAVAVRETRVSSKFRMVEELKRMTDTE